VSEVVIAVSVFLVEVVVVISNAKVEVERVTTDAP